MLAVLVPPGVVTRTLLLPRVPAGVVAVIVVSLTTCTLPAAAPPMVTAVAPVKLLPERVMAVPPAVGPDAGVTDSRNGAAVCRSATVQLPALSTCEGSTA